MTIVDLERSCTSIPKDRAQAAEAVSRSLAEYRRAPAYVLLGDPGAGKTISFNREREHTPGAADEVIDARDFITFDHPEWHGRTLFIDGLDEIRAGSDDGRTALDRVRTRLGALGKPRFRLSCREADWLGSNDWARLQAVAPGGELTVLRLDALTLDDVQRIVGASHLVHEADRFIDEARDRGLRELLLNPQTLALLIEAVGGTQEWPKSRIETFELACRQLAREKNEEHRSSRRDARGEDGVLEDAGRICALLLLSGTPGVSALPSSEEEHVDYPPLQRLDPTPEGMAAGESEVIARRRRLALSSRLFRGVGGSRHTTGPRLEPVHRHIAEFLGGRYLARRIRQGLPVARVLALVTASDGGVVTAHRGSCGWLASHSKAARLELIDRDPIGVGLYGDIGSFSTEEKRALLLALRRSGPKLQDLHWQTVHAFAPLAAKETEDQIRHWLTANAPGVDDQYATQFLLMLLSEAAPMTRLAEPLLAILREPAWWPGVRYWALDAFLRHSQGASSGIGKLNELLTDVYDGRLADSENRIAGKALERLYPSVVGPADVWRYLARTNRFGTHWFWSRLAEEERSSEDEVPVLLDTLPQYVADLRAGPHSFLLATVAAKLLVRGLDAIGTNLSPARLYDWLSTPVDCRKTASGHVAEEQRAKIAKWLERHPDAYKLAFREGLRRGTNDKPSIVVHKIQERLYEAAPPDDFGSWCLDEAETLAASRPALARQLFEEARRRRRDGEEGISRERLEECLRRHPSWRPPPEDPKAEEELREAEREWKESRRAFEEEREQRRRQWLDAVRQEVPTLLDNRGAPWILQRMAEGWFERGATTVTYEERLEGSRSEEIPLQRWLAKEFDPHEDLAVAALQGLRGVPHRRDMPDADEIFNLRSKSRRHRLSVPFLVALQDRHQEAAMFVDELTERQQRQALALYYCVGADWGRHPAWYRRLVQRRPEVAASVLLPFARAEIRAGRDHVAGLRMLHHDRDHAELARLVSLSLLRGFPVRAPARQLSDLKYLLWAALRHADEGELRALIAEKLAARSLTVAQRSVWLAAGLITNPETYAVLLEEFVDGNQQRARQLSDFLWFESLRPPDELSPRALEALIRQLGRTGVFDNHLQDSPDPSPGRLGSLIELLASAPEHRVAGALRRLVNDESLSEWRPNLLVAVERHAVVSRDASYKRPELAAVRGTLEDRAPANAPDLAALALDRLDELNRSVRTANTNVWSQYWNQDSHGRATEPKPENACRDALSSQLRSLLPDEVDVQPEGHYAANRRADIRLACSDFHVPVEIKKNSHAALWRAARDQLVAKYTQDQASSGYGIFLVLWFGDQNKVPLDETESRPVNPDELKRRLEASLAKQLPLEQQHKIGVRVIDVSKP
ncbi:MAG: hypothetical protein F4Z28_10875 [Gammaproteobacteria bacterium]|nr:hypothetical protein [Gammaproteobacteria bacterium]